jgi:hypothetical protein
VIKSPKQSVEVVACIYTNIREVFIRHRPFHTIVMGIVSADSLLVAELQSVKKQEYVSNADFSFECTHTVLIYLLQESCVNRMLLLSRYYNCRIEAFFGIRLVLVNVSANFVNFFNAPRRFKLFNLTNDMRLLGQHIIFNVLLLLLNYV